MSLYLSSRRTRILAFVLVVASLSLVPLVTNAQGQLKSAAQIDREADALLAKLTLEQKIDLIHGVDGMFIPPMPQIGLPSLKMSDGPMGVRTWGPSTAYAAGIGLAASWDRALAQRVGASIGRDARVA